MNSQIFSSHDVELLKEGSSDSVKISLVKKLYDNFKLNHLHEDERLVGEEILRLLANDISIRIRQHVATKFCDNLSLPVDVAVRLANDLEDIVAIPIIQNSQLLTDIELARIIQNGNIQRQQAVSNRRKISEDLCDLIISKAAPEVVERLLYNKMVKFNGRQAEKVITNYSSNQPILRALIINKKIVVEQAHDLLTKVSDDLQKMLIVHYNIPKNVVNNLIHDSKEYVLMNLILSHSEKRSGDVSLMQIIDNLHTNEELTFSLLIKALSLGHVSFFEAGLAKLAGIPFENAHKLVNKEDFAGFKALYEKCGLPNLMLDAVYKFALIAKAEKAKETHSDGDEKIYHRILYTLSKAANDKAASNLDYLVTIVDFSLRKANLL